MLLGIRVWNKHQLNHVVYLLQQQGLDVKIIENTKDSYGLGGVLTPNKEMLLDLAEKFGHKKLCKEGFLVNVSRKNLELLYHETELFTLADKLRLCVELIESIEIIYEQIKQGKIELILLHDSKEREQLFKRFWRNFWKSELPLTDLRNYFGEKIAFYFGWVSFYIRWLRIPGILGLLLFIFQTSDGSVDHALLPFYSIFMAFWSLCFLIFWNREQARLAAQWEVFKFEKNECARHEFYGEKRISAITSEEETYYPE
jgi:hypothetical protein